MPLLGKGHQVVVHAPDQTRAGTLSDVAELGASMVVGDLASHHQTRALADQVKQLGRMDAIVDNAGVFGDAQRFLTPDGTPLTLAVNVPGPLPAGRVYSAPTNQKSARSADNHGAYLPTVRRY